MRRAPLLLLVLMVFATFRGILAHLDDAYIGRYYVDAWGTQWFYWFTEHALLYRDEVAKTSMFFFPWGKDVYSHTGGNVLDAALDAPLRALFGPVVGYNLFVGALILSNVWGMRRLLAELGVSAFSAWITGILFAFNPFLLTELRDGRPTQAMLVFALLFWTYFLRAGASRKSALVSGVFLALTGLTYWYYAILAAPAAAAMFFFDREPGAMKNRVIAAAAAAILVAPFAVGMMTSEHVPGLFDTTLWSATEWSPMTLDGLPVGILAFDPLRRMSGFWVQDPDGTRIFTPEWVTLLRPQVVLAAFGLLFASRRVRIVGLCLLVPSLLLSLGPEWHGIPNVPYLLAVKFIRVMQRLWWPARAMVYVHVGLAVLSAASWDRLGPWPRSRLALVGLAAGWWLVDLKIATLVPMPAWSAAVPDVYKCLAKDVDKDPVFELPYGYSQAHLYYQTAHEHPIFGGMIEDNKIFTPEKQQIMRLENTFVKALIDLADAKSSGRDIRDPDKAALHDLGYKWIVLDKLPYQNPSPFPELRPRTHFQEVRQALEGILGEPVYEDDSGIIWAPWGGTSPCGTTRPERKGPSLRHRSRTNEASP